MTQDAIPPPTGIQLTPFALAVHRALKSNSLSLADAARRVNQAAAAEGVKVRYSRGSVAHWTRGTIPRSDSLRWLAQALGLPISELADAAEQQRAAARTRRGLSPHGDRGRGLAWDWWPDGEVWALSRPRQLCEELLPILARLVYRELVPQTPLPAVRAIVHDQLVRTYRLLSGSQPTGTRRLVQAAAARIAIVANRLAFWADDRGRAQAYLSLAGSLAKEAGDPQLEGLVLASRAYLYSSVPLQGAAIGNAALSLSLVDEALALGSSGWSPRLRARTLGFRAEERALLGDVTGARRDLDEMLRTFASAGPEGSNIDVTGLDIDAVAGHLPAFVAVCSLHLGRTAETVQVVEGLPGYCSHEWAVCGAAHALAGDVDRGAALLGRALETALISDRPYRLQRLVGYRRRYFPRTGPAVEAIDDRLQRELAWT